MSIRNRPNYGVYTFDLSDAAGLGETNIPVDLYAEGTRIALVSAVEDGDPTNAVVSVQLGRSLGDPIPFSVGTEVTVENKFDFARLTWSAQSGVTATFVISDDADGNGISVSAYPSIAAADVTISEGGNTAQVNSDGALIVSASITGGVSNPALNSLPLSGASGTPQIQPGLLGASYYNSTAAAGATEIVPPDNNKNGVIVRTAYLMQGGSSYACLAVGTSAPTSAVSNQSILTTYGDAVVALPHELFLPAGNGLWCYASDGADICVVNMDSA